MTPNWTGLLFAAVIVAIPAQAAAQVFQCVDASGKVSYSDRPCGDGESQEKRGRKSPAPSSTGNGEETQRPGLGHFIDRAEKMSRTGRREPGDQ